MSDMMDFYEQEESMNVKEFISGLLSKWYWFVLFSFIGLLVAFAVTKSHPEVFQVYASVLVNKDDSGAGVDALFGGIQIPHPSKVQNHIEVIKSYRLIEGALKGLHWNTTWYSEGMFKDLLVYKGSSYKLIPLDSAINPCALPVRITPLIGNKYKVVVDGEYLPEGASIPVKVSFVNKATFGEPFVNHFFGFTLYKTSVYNETDMFFVFNDLANMTLDFQERLSVTLADIEADMISLSVDDESSLRAVDFINALINQYVNFGLDIKNRTSENVVDFIDSQVKGIVDSLDRASDTFTSFRSKNKTINLSEEALIVVQSMEDLESQHFMAKMRLDYFNNLRLYMNNETKMSEMATPSVVGVTDVSLNALVVRLGDLYARRSVLASVARDNNPSLISLDREIEQVRVSLSHNLDNLAINAANEVKAIQKRKNNISRDLATLPIKEQKLINIKRDFDINNELFTFLLKKRAEAAITTASNVSDVQVIDHARLNTAVMVRPTSFINLLIGFILGLVLPLAYYVLKDYFGDSILSRKMLEKNSSLPIFGQIAHNATGIDLQVRNFPRSIIAECFRSLRTNLHFLLVDEMHKVIAVHSSVPNEGKSFCAANLADIIAITGKTVLLVGCDLRKPRLHDIYGLDNSVGLSTFLINEASFEDVIHKTDVKNMSVVCAGPVPPNPAELLGRVEFAEFMTQARESFDLVVLDNAPTLLVTDSSVVSTYVDANLFVMRQDLSKIEHVKIINAVAAKGSFKNVGFIYNDVRKDVSSYGFAYSGSGYYGDGVKKRGFWRRLFS